MSLSSAEFSRIVDRSDMPTLLSATFNDERVMTMALRHYHFAMETIKKLEEEIEQQVVEQQSILVRLL